MSANLYPGIKSLHLVLDTPYDLIRTNDVRDDLVGVKVWYSTTQGFNPANSEGTLAFDGLSQSIIISDLESSTRYYVRYAFISAIDPTTFTISPELTAVVEAGAAGPLIEISGLTSFYRNAGGLITPASNTLQATVSNITSPSYAWAITGATPASATGQSVTITPTGSSNNITVTLTVTGSNLPAPVTIARGTSLVEQGAAGQAGQNGTMSAFPTIYQWTSGAQPTRPTTTSTYVWATGDYIAPSGWSNTAPTNTSPGWVLWTITVPLTVSATVTTSALDWTNSAYNIRASTANGTNGTNGANGAAGTPGSATYLINRGSANTSSQPTDAEVVAAIGRSAQLGDIATINYNSGNNSVAYRATSSGSSATWSLQTSYITGSLIVENTITGSKIVANSITSDQINTNGLTIRDTNGNIILNAGTGVFVGNVTGSINGTSASTVVNNASTALSTANSASTAASTAQSTANSASTAASTAQSTANSAQNTANSASSTASTALSTANTANSNASSALSAANSAISGLANKLNSDSRNILSGSGGLATGTLNWNSSGVRNSGFGIGITANGIVAFNSSGQQTFALNGNTGDATFSGSLNAATGTFAGSLSAATGTFSGTLSAASGSFAGNLTAQTITTANIVNQAVSQVYTATTSGSSVSVTISVPSGASAYIISVQTGSSRDLDGNEFLPCPGNLFISGSLVRNGTGVILDAGANPPAGSYTISATRSLAGGFGSFQATMVIVVQVAKR